MTTGINTASLYRLQTWLSPSFPVGAYTFSHGLEYAVEAGWVSDVASAQSWLANLVEQGTGHADLVLLAAGWRANSEAALQQALTFGLAMSASRELRLESTAQGDAFLHAVASAWPCDTVTTLQSISGDKPYPVVVGAVAAAHGIPLIGTLHAYAHAFVSNLVSALLRAIPLGQSDGQRLLANLEMTVEKAVTRASSCSLDDLSASTPLSDIASMRHETQYSRLFRS
ncbi:MAG: urease accessory protein UreF [Pseudomonadota bacterium]